MNKTQLLRLIQRHLSNLPGRPVRGQWVVIESDDWGAIRTSSPEARAALARHGYKPRSADEARYVDHDGLATSEDLGLLFDTLQSVRDGQSHPAVFTAVSVVANPDFDQIKASDFQTYASEPFTETLKRYPAHGEAFAAWRQGAECGVFHPEFHGAEHLNVAAWMRALQAGEPDTRAAFDLGMYGITPRQPVVRVSYQAAYDVDEPGDIDLQRTRLAEGLDLFEKLHGRRASFFVPPNGFLNHRLEEVLHRQGISCIGISKVQREPVGNGAYNKRRHYIGQCNRHGQTYLTRNAFFEPNSPAQTDWVASCLRDIAIAFRWRKPAVISSHRCNYIGWLNPDNRANSLRELKRLLDAIIKQWPSVEFITSAELGRRIRGEA
jgi:hypothetical protein